MITKGLVRTTERADRWRIEELPLRSELYSVDQLDRHAKGLAGWHQVARGRGADRLLPRLADNEETLLRAYRLINAAVENNRRITSAAEWVLDNYYLIEEQIRTARRHLPRQYSRELPHLVNGPRREYPRVYDIAYELISHVDGRIDAETLSAFIAAYQTVAPLKLGELWAIPIMLRLALIENLRRVANRVAAGRESRDAATHWAELLLETTERNPAEVVIVLAEMARAQPALNSAFVTEFTRLLQGHGAELQMALHWLEQRLAEQGQTLDLLIHAETRAQAADHVSMGNSIGSLRLLAAIDWQQFVESLSAVERILRTDPANVYPAMDFATRDRYRHVVEVVAKRSQRAESEVAQAAIDLALRAGAALSAASGDGSSNGHRDSRIAHVGYYLISKGRRDLERAVRMRQSLPQMARRFGRRHPLVYYLGSVFLLTVFLGGGGILVGWESGLLRGWKLAVFGLFPVIVAMQLAIALVNWIATQTVRPRQLPRMDFSEGIPPEFQTMVVVPTMLTSPANVDDLLNAMEVRYLANREPRVQFALLSDFADAPSEHMPGDDELVERARLGILALNEKYAPDGGDVFYLLHRPRQWNPQEGMWIGYERKRGKLCDFNALLRGGDPSRFLAIVGDMSIFPRVRYVITLDTDTQLPRDAARMLVGTMAHPLNRPIIDTARRVVIDGYAILQPRVAISLPAAERSWYARLFAGEPGIDPYTRVVSDVYQDVFMEGSFIGKGIYDVDAFEAVLGGRFPENRVLSHDLLESCYARGGLVSDVQLYEDYPSRYAADVSRRHRWMRGDWQIASWLMPRVPCGKPARCRNPIGVLGRWKIFDNLRRSITSPAILVLLLGAWLVGLGPVGFWTLFVVTAVFLPQALMATLDAINKPTDLFWSLHLRNVGEKALRSLAQTAGTLVFLPYESYVALDAIFRTLYRILFSHRKLLEWQTASEAERKADADLPGMYRKMWVAPMIALLCGVCVLLLFQAQWIGMGRVMAAAPLLSVWVISPAIAWWMSRPLTARAPALRAEQRAYLEKLARKTWRYFETFVNANEHWLPPDNFQELPEPLIAGRTSPTNIGMALLANLAAYDFGYLPGHGLIVRTQETMDTIERLTRYRGHLYNWYDTRTLQPLMPLYVSTVDSGNLAGHAMTLAIGLEQLCDQPIVSPRTFGGLKDTLSMLIDAGRGPRRGGARTALLPASLSARLQGTVEELSHGPHALGASLLLLERLSRLATEIMAVVADIADDEARFWAGCFERECRAHREDLVALAPWAAQPPPTESIWQSADAAQAQRLEEVRLALKRLDAAPTLTDVARLRQSVLPVIEQILADTRARLSPEHERWFDALRRHMADASGAAANRIGSLKTLAQRARELAEMDFTFLYDKSRRLFAIGYNVAEHRLDASFYDLLASEARLSSFVAIAQGQVRQEHWFALGRMLTRSGGEPALLSWSGSMFEYLMPLLVMPAYANTLLDQTCKAVVKRQIAYGRQRGVPWGVSESGYNMTDVHLNYQYRAFGVPGLGLKRGLSDDLVIAPYASALALMVYPQAACRNLQRLSAEGQEGKYGLYEAVDYTPTRVPHGEKAASVRSFMAHHQGMSFLSLEYVLLDRPMQRRFESDPLFQATDLLLQERVPVASAPIYPHAAEAAGSSRLQRDHEEMMRVFTNPLAGMPEVHLLSNGRYHVMVSNAGGGYSRWKDLAVTRWREDATLDNFGQFCYVRDVDSGDFWSTSYQPTLRAGMHYEAVFTQAKAEFRRRDHDIDMHVEIGVSPEDDVELRRVTLTNWQRHSRRIEVTSYGEVVIAPAGADAAHRAFGNLFVQTQILRDQVAIICTRRPRSRDENPPWMVHLMTLRGLEIGQATYETDRARFIGRNRTAVDPAAMNVPQLSDTAGSPLDPIVAIRRLMRLGPEETATIDVITGMAETREGAMALVEKYRDARLADRIFGLAWTHSQIVLRVLGADEGDAQLYGRLAGSIIYASGLRRAAPSVLAQNRRGQSGLWGYGISGDLPIALVRIGDTTKIDLVRQAIQAHAYWRQKGLLVDLVIWNEDHSGYRQVLHEQIMSLIAAANESALVDKPGGLFVRRPDQMSEEDRALIQAVARVVLTDAAGTLAEQVERRGQAEPRVPRLLPLRWGAEPVPTGVEVTRRDLLFFNGFGGFTRDAREYIITTGLGIVTPAPWVNVIANPNFGTLVSESGGGYTWLENSHEFRITPWSNDPVGDVSGEAFYIRDEDTGRYWSPTPLPAPGAMPYTTRHGLGYSIFEYAENGIHSELLVYVAMDAPVKFAVLRVRNESGRSRRLSVTGYVEWVLGEQRWRTMMYVVPEIDPKSGAIFARNAYNSDFPDRVAFFDVNEPIHSVTADRTSFLGRNGSYARPAAMERARLSGKAVAGVDPCGAIQVPCELAESQEKELVFILGVGRNGDDAQALIQRFRSSGAARTALEGVWNYWNRTLGVVWVETPEPGLNVLANGWLLYQIISCRMWGRTGLYQSGGAYGFRDQLQDAMALLHAAPELYREHLLRCAARQFKEGDVQHWWHPPTGRGVRTRISDDFLWLPYATARYVLSTGDTGVLEEQTPFLEGRPINPDEEGYYDLPHRTEQTAPLYEHCRRAIRNGLRFGAHGLPLMGTGDWNDGMNLVGAQGKGESVWLGFFLYAVLQDFAQVARRHDDAAFADECVSHASQLRLNLLQHAWDGAWYRRAYFDNGDPLGSASNEECAIDSLPQSWSVLSGAGEAQQSGMAMEAVEQRLVRRNPGMVLLFDPPFDRSNMDPGYIKGYVPGVRENGGQYTHAAVWVVMAYAAMGDAGRAWDLFRLINPVNHACEPDAIARYKVEPYVVAADVYGLSPHTGRGGWTWYTGSAGWMYRLIVESLLGMRLDVDKLYFQPVMPDNWDQFTLHYRYRETFYHIRFSKPAAAAAPRAALRVLRVMVDAVENPDGRIPLVDDRQEHRAEVELG